MIRKYLPSLLIILFAVIGFKKVNAQFSSDCQSGVASWYSADTGVTVLNGNQVVLWADRNSNSRNNLEISWPLRRPSLNSSSQVNGHSTIEFDGNDVLKEFLAPSGTGSNNGNLYGTGIRSQQIASSYFVLRRQAGNELFNHGRGSYRFTVNTDSFYWGGTGSNNVVEYSNGIPSNEYVILSAFVSGGPPTFRPAYSIYLNGKKVDSLTSTSPFALSNTADTLKVGSQWSFNKSNPSAANGFVGDIAEIYTAATDHSLGVYEKYHTYLSLKYGISLDGNITTYTNDNGDNLFQYGSCGKKGYNNRITGIFRTDCFNLSQVKSVNQESNPIITGALTDNGGTFSNPNSFAGDGSAFLWGDDGNNPGQQNNIDVPAQLDSRVDRVWKVSETGMVGEVTMQFNLAPFVVSGIKDYQVYVIIDTDGDGQLSDEDSTGVNTGTQGVFAMGEIVGDPNASPPTQNNSYGLKGQWNELTETGQFSYDFSDCDIFSIGFRTNGGTVPVDWAYFNASKLGDKVELNWGTASEENNDFFIVEKSNNLETWTELEIIEGAGTSLKPLHYLSMDENPALGVNYYRVKQIDFDGTSNYSKVVAIDFNSDYQLGNSSIYPNPANKEFTVNLPFNHGKIDIDVFDLSGKMVLSKRIDGQQNAINISTFDKGVYLVKLKKNGFVKQHKLIVE